MLKDFFTILPKVLHLRSIIGFNSMVFALKKTPVIGKVIPDRLYGTAFLKIIYWIVHIIKEVGALFIGKMCGISCVYIAAWIMAAAYKSYDMIPNMSEKSIFGMFALFFFILYALIGLLLNTKFFKKTTEKDYLVFMIRMDAKKLNNTLFAYELGKIFVGYYLVGPVAAIFGCPFWAWLVIPFLAVFMKLFGAGFLSLRYQMFSKKHKPLRGSYAGDVFKLVAVILLMPILMVIFINGYYIPLPIIFAAVVLFVVLGICGFFVLKNTNATLHRKALHDGHIDEKASTIEAKSNTKAFKKIKAEGSVKGDKKGFEYLNALFVKRHMKMLVMKPIVFSVVMLAILAFAIYLFIAVYYEDNGADACRNMVMNNLVNLFTFRGFSDPLVNLEDSAFQFFRWCAGFQLFGLIVPISMAENSFKCTQAMYINCDNSLMTFSFFKKREMIMKLFDIRFKQLIKINIMPAMVSALAVDLVLFVTGGQDYPFQYLLAFIIAGAIVVIYSMSWLALYYLFQPFTTTVNVKSGAYAVARTVFSIIMAVVMWIPANSLVVLGVTVVFAVLFVITLRKLVYKHAPKTWRVKA